MFKFLRGSFPKIPDEPSVAPDSVSHPSESPPIDIQRELIRGVLKDTMRRLGLPYDWLSCDVFFVAHHPGEETMHVQITLMKWNETFLRYALALETQLRRGLDRIDPSTDHAKLVFSWRIAPDCGCPFTVMPPARIWQHAEAATAPVNESPSLLDRRKSPRAAKGAKRPPDDTGYERTQLSSLD